MEKLSQTEQIRAHLEAGNAITPIDALSMFNCFRLGARILELKKAGMSIFRRMIERNGKHFAEYSIYHPSELHARDRYAVANQILQNG